MEEIKMKALIDRVWEFAQRWTDVYAKKRDAQEEESWLGI
jgi:hypothetical protein